MKGRRFALNTTGPSEHASLWLDALRGFAAFGVFTSHWRDCLFRDYPQLHYRDPLIAAAYFITGLGHEWVVVFFVLSGYLVGGSLLRQLLQQRWSWRHYAFDRLTRLYVVLIPALLLGGLIDLVGLHFFGSSSTYTAHHGMRLMTAAPTHQLTLRVLAGNYMFLQGIAVPVFGTNGPLWSLSYEFWYYVAFPLLAFAFWKDSPAARRLLSFTWLLAVLIFIGWKMACMGTIWLMGVAIYWLRPTPQLNKAQRLFGLSCASAITIGCLAWCKHTHSMLADYVLGMTILFLVYAVLSWATVSPVGWCRRVLQYSAKSSYTLYLLHLPLLLLLTAWIDQPRWEPTSRTLFYGLGVLVVVLIYVHVAYVMFEKHTSAFRSWLLRNLRRSIARGDRLTSPGAVRTA